MVDAGERMIFGYDHRAVPLVAIQMRQLVVLRDRFGGNRDVGFALDHHFADLGRIALLDRQSHVGVAGQEGLDGGRQGIAGLGVGGGDGETAAIDFDKFFTDAFEVLRLQQNHFRNAQHFLARRGDIDHALAVAHKNLHAQFVFQEPDLFGNARLRGVEFFRRLGDIQPLFGDFDQITQLLQFHVRPAPFNNFRFLNGKITVLCVYKQRR